MPDDDISGATAADDTPERPDSPALPDDLDTRPVGEHVEIYQQVHEQLQAQLAGIDDD